MTKPLPDPLNSGDEDAAKVAAALADAAHAGGLSENYYREAEAALRRLFSRTIKGSKTSEGYLDPANWSWCAEFEDWRGPGDHSVEIDPDVSTVIIEDWCDVAQAPIEIVRRALAKHDAEQETPRMPDSPGAWWFWSFTREEWAKASVQYRSSKLVMVNKSGIDIPVAMCLWGGRASSPPVCAPAEAALEQKRDFEYETRLARENRVGPRS